MASAAYTALLYLCSSNNLEINNSLCFWQSLRRFKIMFVILKVLGTVCISANTEKQGSYYDNVKGSNKDLPTPLAFVTPVLF